MPNKAMTLEQRVIAEQKVQAIQRVIGEDADGIPGRRTRAGVTALFDSLIHPMRPMAAEAESGKRKAERLDDRTEKNIATLSPAAQAKAREFMAAALEAGIALKIIGGHRSYEEQAAIYAKGRTAPGQIVTKAKPGYSQHNFGIAWDIGIFGADGRYYSEHRDYARAGEIGRRLGLEWGGDYKSIKDEPHFALQTGLSLAQMRARVARGEEIA